MKSKTLIFFVLIASLFTSCGSEDSTFVIDESNLPDVEVNVKRYGKALFELDTSDISVGLQQIKPNFK